MSNINEKLDKLEQEEARSKFKVLFFGVLFSILISAYFAVQMRREWEHQEVKGVFQSIRAIESDTSPTAYSASVLLDNGKTIEVMVDRIAVYKKGRRSIFIESTDIDSGMKKYRYVGGE